MTKNPHIGSSLDDFLIEEGILAETDAAASKRVLAWQLADEMKAQGVSKTELARRMGTSRAAVDRLLDPNNESVTLQTLCKAAEALQRKVRLDLLPLAS